MVGQKYCLRLAPVFKSIHQHRQTTSQTRLKSRWPLSTIRPVCQESQRIQTSTSAIAIEPIYMVSHCSIDDNDLYTICSLGYFTIIVNVVLSLLYVHASSYVTSRHQLIDKYCLRLTPFTTTYSIRHRLGWKVNCHWAPYYAGHTPTIESPW